MVGIFVFTCDDQKGSYYDEIWKLYPLLAPVPSLRRDTVTRWITVHITKGSLLFAQSSF